mmetsp:Transcript_4201/g.19047  ORF Transcript_4201/g.19047 Transcript_4201/m.19047 type:complete len:205 (+) Transcript_4201:2074-2688(+)
MRTAPELVAAKSCLPPLVSRTCVSVAPFVLNSSLSMRSSPSNCFRVASEPTPKTKPSSGATHTEVYSLDLSTFSLSRWNVDNDHSYTAPSRPVETSLLSSAENAMPVTLPPCPRQLPTFSQVYMLYTWITEPFTAAKYLPPLLKEHSRQPLMLNSRYGLMSSMRRLHSRSLSANPTNTCRPLGWNATLEASSGKNLTISSALSR